MANEPTTNPPPATETKRFVRTFAQDVARLSGKPIPPSMQRPTPAPAKPTPAPRPALTPKPEGQSLAPAEPQSSVPSAATLADELRSELGDTTPATPASEPAPAPKPEETPRAPQSYREPIPEMEPAYVIPKAPSTNESREDVLARLKRKVAAEQQQDAIVLPKAPSTNESREAVLARLKTAAAKEAEPKAKAPLTPLTKGPAGPERIHTYKTDFAEHVEKRGASALSVLAAQSDAGQSIDTVVFKEKHPFPVAILGGFLLILVGGGILFGAYYAVTNRTVPLLTPRIPSLITADESRELAGTTGYPLAELAALAEQPLKENAVLIPYLTFSTTTETGAVSRVPLQGGKLIAALKLPMPDILARSMREESTIGIVHAGDDQRAFFLLRVDSFERSFAGMLAWEPTIAADLALLYPQQNPDVTASSTPALSEEPTAFVDEVFNNRDVRTLRDAGGRIILMYGFKDKETIVIARNEAAYQVLIERLSVSKGQ